MKQCTIAHKDTGVFLSNEKKTKVVTLITFITMVVEISVGYWSGSMSLLADGWHMASHTLALFLSVIVYYLYRQPRFRSAFTFGGGKILSLGGYTSAIFLIFIAGSMIYESLHRFRELREIHYEQALWVAVIGLGVNLLCAYILHDGSVSEGSKATASCGHGHSHAPANKLAPAAHKHDHHHHHHGHHHGHDHNHQGAYIHILTDALTSVFAIIALVLGMNYGLMWLDPLVGILGGIVVFKWSLGLVKQSGMDLLDAHEDSIDQEKLVTKLEADGSKVVDIHLWKLAPDQVGCEIVIKNNLEQRSADYRDRIQKEFNIHHLIIEVV